MQYEDRYVVRTAAAAAPAIEVQGLTKAYTPTTGLFEVDFEVPAGSAMALLGPNGAGKTTAVRILATLLRPDSGSLRVGGIDVLTQPRQVQALIGVTNQSSALDERLSGLANLRMFARLHRVSWPTARRRCDGLLDLLGLGEAAGKPVRGYSGGMVRKLDLAISLVGRPAVLFLDEPTTGLDPASRKALWDVIRALVAEGATVLLTTQYLDEADALADTITFIDRGHVIARGTPGELKSRLGGRQVDLTVASPREAQRLAAGLAAFAITVDQARLHVRIGDTVADLSELLAAVGRSGVALQDYQVRAPSLDDVYFHVTGHSREAAGPARATAWTGQP